MRRVVSGDELVRDQRDQLRPKLIQANVLGDVVEHDHERRSALGEGGLNHREGESARAASSREHPARPIGSPLEGSWSASAAALRWSKGGSAPG
jgi:hypothetical protein